MIAATPHPAGGVRRFVADRIFDGFRFHERAALVVRDGRVVGLENAELAPDGDATVRLPEGSILAPGFVDVQVNGGGGVLFNDAPSVETLRTIAEAHRQVGGTTALLPTLISDQRDVMRAAIAAVRDAIDAGVPGIVGIHLEGPFLNPSRKGIHDETRIATFEPTDVDLLCSLGSRGVTLVTLAPERVPLSAIKALARAGVRVCAGHTEATEEELRRAFDAGLGGFTHLYNAMSQMGPREAGAVGFALTDRRPVAGIIADGLHVGASQLRLAYERLGPDRLMLVTDAMSPVGAPDPAAAMTLFGRTIRHDGDRLTGEDGTLAGAMLDMATGIRRMVQLAGASLEDALVMATRTPARFIGLEADRGHLRPGAHADVIALGVNLEHLSVQT